METTKRRQAGFTLVELAVVLAIISILAGMTFALTRWQVRNASLDAATDDLVVRLAGLPGSSLTDGQDRVFVFLDRAADGTPARTYVLTTPGAGWMLSSFDATRPGTGAASFDEVDLPSRSRLLTSAAAAAPAPLQAAMLYDTRMLSTCAGVACFAVRFTGDGEVRGEAPGGGDPGAPGFGFVLADTEDTGASAGAKRRGIVLGFPTGVVKSYVP